MPTRIGTDPLVLHLPIEAGSIATGRRAASGFALDKGCDAETVWRLQLAVSEALTNAVRHAFRTWTREAAERELVLRGEAAGGTVRLRVTDNGGGLRPRTDSPGLGLGLKLITQSCDECSFDDEPHGGLTVAMGFRIVPARDPRDVAG